MNWLIGRIAIICIFVTLSGCTSVYSEDESGTPGAVITGAGIITYVDLEGGFYGIIDEDGSNYYSLNLASEYANDGMQVTYTLQEKKDVVTMYMWGTPVTILEMNTKQNITGSDIPENKTFSDVGTVVYQDDDVNSPLIIGEKGGIYLPFNTTNKTCLKEGSVISFTFTPYVTNTSQLVEENPVTILSCIITGNRHTVEEIIKQADYTNQTTVFGYMQVNLTDSENGKKQVLLMRSGGSSLILSSREPVDAVMIQGQYMEASGYLQQQSRENPDEYPKFDAVSLISLSGKTGTSDAIPV